MAGACAGLPQVGDDARVDVGGDDLEVAAGVPRPRDSDRVHDRPRLVALGRGRFVAAPVRGARSRPGPTIRTRRIRRVGSQRLQHAEAEVHDVAGFDRRVGAEAAMPIELGDGGGRGGVLLGDELLLVEEAHRPQVFGGDAGARPRGSGKAASSRAPK